jgi:hypothetical protein
LDKQQTALHFIVVQDDWLINGLDVQCLSETNLLLNVNMSINVCFFVYLKSTGGSCKGYIVNEAVVDQFKVLPQHLRGGIESGHVPHYSQPGG